MIGQQCAENCGYIAGITAAIAYGSFGVPVKSDVACRLDIDPLVMQSYKSLTYFLCCWLVLLIGESCRFTPWGILSGIFWVPGGVAGIFAIRNAGLALAKGTWASVAVLTSFFWGIFVFDENVKSIEGACGACLTLIAGLVGMSIFSKSEPKDDDEANVEEEGKELLEKNDEEGIRRRMPPKSGDYTTDNGEEFVTNLKISDSPTLESTLSNETSISPSSLNSLDSNFSISPKAGEGKNVHDYSRTPVKSSTVFVFDRKITLSRREMGVLAAIFNGLWGGTNLIPLHFASQDGFGGAGYAISFACGSLFVTLCLWALRFFFELCRLNGDVSKAVHALPSFYFRQMWLQGFLSGLLISLGSFTSIIAVTYLGQGVGYSFTQTSMLVSGLWGISKFGEIKGKSMILKWIFSAFSAVAGIMWLSYEHAS